VARTAEIDIDLTQLMAVVNTLDVTVDVEEYVSDSVSNAYSNQISKQFQIICVTVAHDNTAVDVSKDLYL
jgi:hypothetical protein